MTDSLQRQFVQSDFWQAASGLPKGVFAGQTLSIVDPTQPIVEPYLQQNLALHVGDDATQVQKNRTRLLQQLQSYGATQLIWLNQTHSRIAHEITDKIQLELLDGDGLVTEQKGIGLVMMTADCLPIVVSNQTGSEVACIHAGWRGLADGIIEATVAKMKTQPSYAWIGAAISQPNFEVGAEVKAHFEGISAAFTEDFIAKDNGKYLGDLYAIATKKLTALGVQQVSGADRCSYEEVDKFYSFRRHSQTGRMATFVFISSNC